MEISENFGNAASKSFSRSLYDLLKFLESLRKSLEVFKNPWNFFGKLRKRFQTVFEEFL